MEWVGVLQLKLKKRDFNEVRERWKVYMGAVKSGKSYFGYGMAKFIWSNLELFGYS